MAKQGTIGITYSRRSFVHGREVSSSVARQNDDLARAVERDGLTAEHYSDAQGHRSGKSAKNRPEYRKAIARISDSDVRAIYFDALDRAWRNVEEWSRMLRLCRESNVAVKLVGMGITLDGELDPHKKVFLDQMAVMAEFESNIASTRQKNEVRHKKQLGIYWGSTPFGAKRIGREMKARHIRHIEQLDDGRTIDHGKTVELILTLYATGLSWTEIADKLNTDSIVHIDRKGKHCAFKLEAVRTITQNILFYTGHVVIDRKWNSKDSRVQLEGDGTLLEQYARAMNAVRSDRIERLVSDELACQVIASRQSRRRLGRSQSEPRALLTPILYLDDERVMRFQTIGGKAVYRTRTRDSVVVPVDVVESQIMSRFSAMQFSEKLRTELRAASRKTDDNEHRARSEREIVKLSDKLERLRKMRAEGLYDHDLDGFWKQYRETENEIVKLRIVASEPSDLDKLMDTLEGLGAALNALPVPRRKRAIQQMIERVEIDKTGVIVKITPVLWAARAFSILFDAVNTYHKRPRQVLNPTLVSLLWLSSVVTS